MPLLDFELLLPFGEWRHRDWPTEIHKAEGVTKRILQIQELAVHGIAGIEPAPNTPEKLGYAVLWARGFLLLQSALDLQKAWSVRVADPLYRMAFELWLQVSAIRQPWEVLNALAKDKARPVSVSEARLDAEWAIVADRLRGFTAWALTNDLVYYRYRSSSWELGAIYTPTDPASLRKGAPEDAVHEYLFGPEEVVSRAEAAADGKRARARHEGHARRLLDWLADPAFGHWTADNLAPWIEGGKQTDVPSLYSIFETERGSVFDMLREMGAPYLYGAYSRGSMLMHGASIEHFIAVSSETKQILPLVLASEDEGAQFCAALAEMCHSALLALWGVRDHCISK